MTIGELAAAAVGLTSGPGRAILGIAGVPGAGKTTLVERLLETARQLAPGDAVAHVPMDGFHLGDAQLDRIGLRDWKGAPATFDAAGYAATLHRIRTTTDEPVYVPGFTRELEQPLAAALVVLPPARLVITEGNYLLLDEPGWRSVREQLDQVWFVTRDEQQRLEQLIQRHIQSGKAADAAREWVIRNDEPNAHLVAGSSIAADRVVVNSGDFRFLR
jgi:pantothenate kinase